ncbi:MAG TPA: ChaN family lipoprotein [Pyrinomonadaceae bacterium]
MTTILVALSLAAGVAARPLEGLRAGAAPRTPSAETPYRIFDSSGRASTLEAILAAMDETEVVFVGETHNDPAAHLLELELLRRARERFGDAAVGAARRRSLALSLEMFERDVQLILDEYLGGLISERHFLASSRPWNNYQSDYRPLVELAREQGLAVIAANAPARYVNRVSRLGPATLKDLSTQARTWLPPLPYGAASAAYAARFNRLMQAPQVDPKAPAAPSPHGAAFLLDAQSLRDASMGYFIAEHLRQHPRGLVLHVNGTFHSEERRGAPEQLLRYRPQTRLLVVTIIPDKSYPNFDKERMSGLGDFVILTDPALPRTF